MASIASLRVVAFLIDLVVYVALWVFFYFNIHLGDYLSWLLASVYILIKDGLFGGQSIGKLVFRLKVVQEAEEDKPASLIDSVQRNAILVIPNIFRFIPFLGSLLFIVIFAWETYLIFTHPEGRRWGDQFARTRVLALRSGEQES